jgi:hypothetical protein
LNADTSIARVSRRKLRLVAQNARQIGELVDDDFGSHLGHRPLDGIGVEHIRNHGANAGSLKFVRHAQRARRAGHIVIGVNEQRGETPTDRAAGTREKNIHPISSR